MSALDRSSSSPTEAARPADDGNNRRRDGGRRAIGNRRRSRAKGDALGDGQGIAERLARCIDDPRARERVRHDLDETIRFRALIVPAGGEDADDIDMLRDAPAFTSALGGLPQSGAELCSRPTPAAPAGCRSPFGCRRENLPTTIGLKRMMAAMLEVFGASFAQLPRRRTNVRLRFKLYRSVSPHAPTLPAVSIGIGGGRRERLQLRALDPNPPPRSLAPAPAGAMVAPGGRRCSIRCGRRWIAMRASLNGRRRDGGGTFGMGSDRIDSAGKLVAIGGGEDRTSQASVLRRVLSLAPRAGGEIGVITTASAVPEEVFASYREVFEQLGTRRAHHLQVRTRQDAQAPEHADAVGRCDVVFMSGGDQLRLTHVLGGSPLLAAMRAARARGTVIAGTSAGAAAMSATMIYDGAAADALRKGAVKMSAGLAFVEDVVIDSHFLERGRFTRLMEVGATNPEYVGIGLGEDAAVVVHDGPVLEAVGSGHVIVVDCLHLESSNVTELSDGEPVALAHVVMHALTSGFGYDVKGRRFLHPHELDLSLEGADVGDCGAPGASRP